MNADAAGRVVQGVLSGVGFIGAGALLHGGSGQQVHGLATAASIWVSAAIGTAAALAVWPLIAGGVTLGLFVL
ncbi:MgtC/SapB family protein, partial [Aureimonas leprariae]